MTALRKHINTPLTSSIGRLFDAVTSLSGLRQRCSFEGQAAMALEFAQRGLNNDECYPFHITPVTTKEGTVRSIIEVEKMITALLKDTDAAVIAAKFHNTLTAMLLRIVQQVGEPQVVLSGGCFQNRSLLKRVVKALRQAGFTPFWQQTVPPNDGGIALGQIIAALRDMRHVSGCTRENNQYPG